MLIALKRTYNIFFIFSLIMLWANLTGCTPDTDESNYIEQTIAVNDFSELIIHSGVKVNIQQSESYKVVIRTSEERIHEVSLETDGEILHVKGEKPGIFSNTYTPVEVRVYTPHLTKVRHSGNHLIYSDDTLSFPSLTLISENYNSDYNNIGDFDLSIDNDNLKIVSNGISTFKIQGHTAQLEVSFYTGTGQFQGEDLIAEAVHVFHRGENSIKVYPVESLTGDLYSVGNLEAYHHPPLVDVEIHYTGQLIFID
ncbi:MAG: hypothetical protein CSA40_01485 [Flavobacteriales bacterium]|nr:MAG: hypothetical protein CSA40_01485 [Flavobacteriales bacterium]